MPNAEQKIAVVLGASSGTGLGAAIARRLASDGYLTVLSGRRADALDVIARGLGGVCRHRPNWPAEATITTKGDRAWILV